jgi:hypothetical protein
MAKRGPGTTAAPGSWSSLSLESTIFRQDVLPIRLVWVQALTERWCTTHVGWDSRVRQVGTVTPEPQAGNTQTAPFRLIEDMNC